MDGDGSTDALEATLSSVREQTTPEAAERQRLEAVTERLTERARRAVAALPEPANEADVVRVGSTARGTWLPGDRDIDLFVRFPTALDRDELRGYGLRVGHEVVPDGTEEYAEHPYVKGVVDGFDVDCVPCFDVPAATEIRSAVDRTPFHTAYLRERLGSELAADVRVCKQFCTAIGVYGSDLRTRGFSGYLTELLVIEHGGFAGLLSAVADWNPPVQLDPESHGMKAFDDPLVVIDPTDPTRNVAAVCAASNVARFQHHARRLLADPDTSRFRADPVDPLTRDQMASHLDRRGTEPVAVLFDTPQLVDDTLYPQLRRSLDGLTGELSDLGFRVVRSAVFATPPDETDGPTTGGTDGSATGETDGLATGETDGSATGKTDGSATDGTDTPRTEPADTSATEDSDLTNVENGDVTNVENGDVTNVENGDVTNAEHADGRTAALFVELQTTRLPAVTRHEGPPVSVRTHAEGFYETYDETDAYGPFLDGGRYVVERNRRVRDATAFVESDALFDIALGTDIETALDDGYEVLAGTTTARLAATFPEQLTRYFRPTV